MNVIYFTSIRPQSSQVFSSIYPPSILHTQRIFTCSYLTDRSCRYRTPPALQVTTSTDIKQKEEDAPEVTLHLAACTIPVCLVRHYERETDYHILVAVLACSLSSSLPRALCPPLFDNHCPVSHSISIRYCLLACFACFQVASQNQRTQLASR